MASIMICDPCPDGAPGERLADSLGGNGHAVELFSDRFAFLEAVIARPPVFVVYGLCSEFDPDLRVLRMLRRVCPGVLLIVLTHESTLEQRSAVQPLRPIFYSVAPPDSLEVNEVIRAALRRPQHSN